MSELTTLPEIPVVERDGEPRARDLDVAERLGMSRPRDIRKILARHRGALEGLGPVLIIQNEYRGQRTDEWHLNEEQALYAATVSDAPNAPAVRAMLIRTFVAWRRGHLEPARFDMKAVGGMVKGILARQLSEVMPALVREQVAAELEARNAVPALDFGGTVSAYQIIEMAGVPVEDRQRGTAQMVTRRLIAFCAERRVACFRTPAEVNPSRPFRFPQSVASDWLLGEGHGVERIRNQVERMKAKKWSAKRGSLQTSMQLVTPMRPVRPEVIA